MDSKHWPEKLATANYGAPGSHPKGSCKYGYHSDATDHCYYGCKLCVSCVYYHKRQRLLNEGKKLCTLPAHKYSLHLDSECHRHNQRGPRRVGSNRAGNRADSKDNNSRARQPYRKRRNANHSPRSYHARSSRQRRSVSRSRSPSSSPPRRRRRDRSRSPSS